MVDVMNVYVVKIYIRISALEAVDQTPSGIVHRRVVNQNVAAANKYAIHCRLIDNYIAYRSMNVEILDEQVADFDMTA